MNKLYDRRCGYVFFAFGLMLLVITLSACKNKTADTLEADQPKRPDLLTIPTLNPVSMPTPQISAKDARLPVLPAEGSDFDNGKLLYEAHCATCHGINGEGQLPDPLGPNMAPPHNNDGHTWHHPDQINFETVWYGRNIAGTMPAFYDQLTEAEILQVLAYIKTWWSDESLAVQLERTQAAMNE
ncbi:MAG: cytochrome c [Anaerolineae bacterium]|nr:MAG: cytochrome c [Anaerolineae bacterium]